MTVRRGRIEKFHDDQLIVDIGQLPIVVNALKGVGVICGTPEQSQLLGLARIPDLRDVGKAVACLRQDDNIKDTLEEFGRYQADRHCDMDEEAVVLETLKEGLKLRFAREYPGLEIQVDKSYESSWIVGEPHYGGGGQGDPQPAPEGFALPRPRRRSGVRVGVLDTPLFPAKSLEGRYFANSGDLLDTQQRLYTVYEGHCAFVCSRILERAPAAELHVRGVLDKHGEGSAWEAAKAMAEMADQEKPHVVNLSLGYFMTDDNTAPRVFKAAVGRFGPETVVVAAAANNGNEAELAADPKYKGITTNTASYPAALPGVVGVGSVDQNGERAPFTPSPAPFISLLAPGVDLTGAYVQGKVALKSGKDGNPAGASSAQFDGAARWEGNSFAAAVVSGEIAARTLPGRRSAREALEQLLKGAGRSRGIMPNPDISELG
jgi:hypothetical protein